jgi:Pvc16 N-terminal domain
MLHDLDRTLEELLKAELPPAFVGANATTRVLISFATPDREFAGQVSNSPVINLFLYDVRENLELRNSEWVLERQPGGTATRKRPPVRVDCSYAITIWAASSQSDPQTEHRLLGEVMKALLRHPQIPAAVLQGSMKEQEILPRSLTLRPTQLQSLGEFWQAMGGRPKPAMNYTVTIAIPVYEEEETVSLVVR